MIYKIRWHGRGGAGVVTAARLLGASAALYEGLHAQSFPAFGPERRGAPVQAFTKIASQPIRDRSQIYDPDYVVVLDASLLATVNVLQGLKAGGTVIVNTQASPESLGLPEDFQVITVDATGIALEYLGVPIVNTAMLGAFCAGTGLVDIKSAAKVILEEFGPKGDRNVQAAQAAYRLVGGGVRVDHSA